ncbi:class I SAM-dependent methyltransferase [Aliishimia ponticola]|uniref:Class I SAM-dependent methyltransferase n=1 Tax=Aliishimia ponticola TaxID=2499833 RepID=A0A4S4NHE0_9RHOB|nr:class I SAM-dependent methyltransferase [Aliishimia ponticola]THH39092.1 class I SAM-dependent methyltransferase [Aliishimia ponticola]
MADHFPDLAAKTQAIYEAEAERFDQDRSRRLFEARWLVRFSDGLPRGGQVLDLGCGSGEPISAWLIAEGFALTGMDFAPAMLEIARARWPQAEWLPGDMRTLDLASRYDGIVAWNSFFHLTRDEQRACLPRLARHLAPGGHLLVTVGDSDGETTGRVGEFEVYHASLSLAEYASILEANGLRVTGFMARDPDCTGHSVLLARKLEETTQ